MKILFTILLSSFLFFSCTKTGPTGPAGPAGTNGTNGTSVVTTSTVYTVTPSEWTAISPGYGRIAEYNSQITASSNVLTYSSSDNVNWTNYGATYKADSVVIEYTIYSYNMYFRVVILN